MFFKRHVCRVTAGIWPFTTRTALRTYITTAQHLIFIPVLVVLRAPQQTWPLIRLERLALFVLQYVAENGRLVDLGWVHHRLHYATLYHTIFYD